MTLKEILDEKTKELASLKERISQLESDIDAIRRVMAMADGLSYEPVHKPQENRLANSYRSFSQFISDYCDRECVSSSDIAQLLGMTSNTINNWKKGMLPHNPLLVSTKLAELSGNHYRTDDILELITRSQGITPPSPDKDVG